MHRDLFEEPWLPRPENPYAALAPDLLTSRQVPVIGAGGLVG